MSILSEEEYRLLFSESPVGLLIFNAEGVLIEANHRVRKLLGFTKPSQFKDVVLFNDPNIPEPYKNQLREKKEVHFSAEYDFDKVRNHDFFNTARTGSIYLDFHIYPFSLRKNSTVNGYLAQILDSTKYRILSEELQHFQNETQNMKAKFQIFQLAQSKQEESDEIFHSVCEKSPVGMMVVQNGEVVYINDRLTEIIGYTPEEIYNWKIDDGLKIVHPDDREKFREKYYRQFDHNNVIMKNQIRGIKINGDIFWMELTSREITFRDRFATLLNYVDITEIKKKEHTLRESVESYRILFNKFSEPLIVHSLDKNNQPKKILDVNVVAAEMLEYELDELIGINPVHLFKKNQRKKLSNFYKELAHSTNLIQTIILTKTEIEIPVELRATLIPLRGRIVSMIYFQNIEERQRKEAEYQRSEKLESIGTLAGSIAHDFNNLLTSILGNVNLAKMESDIDILKSHLIEAEDSILRARKLTNKLLCFAKGGVPLKELTDISEFVRYAVTEKLIGSNIIYKDDVDPRVWNAEIDKDQVIQMLENIVENAQEASRYRGNIHLKLENITIKHKNTRHLKPGKYVKISLTDSGKGIQSEILSRIFDPFFTTKEDKLGLGLPVSLSIAENHGGTIDVDTELGKGSTFHIYLPASGNFEEEKASEISSRKFQRILVMDDDPVILSIIVKLLSKLGYQAHQAVNGQEVLEKFKQARIINKPYDLIILDLNIIDGMNGLETMEALKRIDNTVKVIVSSGYSSDPVLSNYEEYGFIGRIPKPYLIEDLKEVIKAAEQGN
ncbi:MAG: PAS domain S-box protein [Candidatus Lokiarchaeota archaeon]|nr:PAS domain S-box protein [Candidatus Lokiarchaeota archaeon]